MPFDDWETGDWDNQMALYDTATPPPELVLSEEARALLDSSAIPFAEDTDASYVPPPPPNSPEIASALQLAAETMAAVSNDQPPASRLAHPVPPHMVLEFNAYMKQVPELIELADRSMARIETMERELQTLMHAHRPAAKRRKRRN